jgi:hypothetical protein
MTLNRVLPGDWAIINGGPRMGLYGRIVEVMYRVRPVIVDGALVYSINNCNFPAYLSDGVVWRVQTLGTPFTLINRQGKAVEGLDWPCRDAWLRPLRMTDSKDQMLLKAGPAPVSTRLQRRG